MKLVLQPDIHSGGQKTAQGSNVLAFTPASVLAWPTLHEFSSPSLGFPTAIPLIIRIETERPKITIKYHERELASLGVEERPADTDSQLGKRRG